MLKLLVARVVKDHLVPTLVIIYSSFYDFVSISILQPSFVS